MGAYVDKDAVLAAARSNWAAILTKHYGAAAQSLGGAHSACPGCHGRDRFRFDDQEGAGTWLCSQGGGGTISGAGIELIMHITGMGWHEALLDLAGKLEIAVKESGGSGGGGSARLPSPAAAPELAGQGKARQFDPAVLERAVPRDLRGMKAEDLMELSPMDPRVVTTEMFLETVYEPGEKVLAFTEYRSQGDFGYEVGAGGKWYRLGARPDVRGVCSEVGPRSGPEGVWYLVQPVTGKWMANPRQGGKLSRRSAEAVTRWTYLVLESDEADEGLWCGFLAGLKLPIQAIYTSGGRSIHALVRLPVRSQWEWDECRRLLLPLLSALGADPGAISGVRLSRLPGCYRGQRLQRLLYLDPDPGESGVPIVERAGLAGGRARLTQC
jgi:hypothetical protein